MKVNVIKKITLAIDAIVLAIVTILLFSSVAGNSFFAKNGKNNKVANTNLSFSFVADPEEKYVKAGDTVAIRLSAEDINVGEDGLNAIVGYLSYDNEDLFESRKLYAGDYAEYTTGVEQDWNVELNQIKDHSMYGKFCIYTMREGITENEVVATLVVKLKDDLKPQTTKIHFTELASSDGEVEVPEEDRTVTLIIYEDEVPVPEEEKTTPTPEEEVKTGDNVGRMAFLMILAVIILILNTIVFGKVKNSKVMSIIAFLLVGSSMLAIRSYAISHNLNINEVWASLNYEQRWLDSESYLVQKDSISRVYPETTVGEYKTRFNDEVNIYSADSEDVLDDDAVVGTGMRTSIKTPTINNVEGDLMYPISVWGDTNGDGKSNQVELTNIIRNDLDNVKWALEGVKFLSADLTVDNKIDDDDVNTSVKYIVYGDLEIPEFEPVVAPTIEFDGEYDEDLECFVSNVTVKITENEEDAQNTEYKIENSEGEVISFTEIERETIDENGKVVKEFELEEDEIYKISTYTTGKLGNRSEIPYTIINVGNTEKEYGYEIQYYYETSDNNFEIDETKTESGNAVFGMEFANLADIPAYTGEDSKQKPGYEIDTTKGDNGVVGLPLNITKDLSTNVVKIYYKAKTYNIEYDLNDRGDASFNEEEGRSHPATYKIISDTITITNAQRPGYDFLGWKLVELDGEEQTNQPISTETIIAHGSIGNRKYEAEWEAVNSPYTIKYFKEDLDGNYIEDEAATETKQALTDHEVTIPEKTYEGFTENTTHEDRIISGYVKADGTLELRRYYSRNSYTLTVIAGENVDDVSAVAVGHADNGKTATAVEGQSKTYSASYKYEQPINIAAEVNNPTGHTRTFKMWEETSDTELIGNITDQQKQITMPLGDVELTASAEDTTNSYKYFVKYYYNGNERASEREVGFAEYGTTYDRITDVPAYVDKLEAGYELDTTQGDNGFGGLPLTIDVVDNENDETNTNVVSVYYNILTYNIDYVMNDRGDASFAEESGRSHPSTYTVESDTITITNAQRPGYSFDGWMLTKLNGETQENPTPNTDTTIAHGSTGDREYTAKWTPGTSEYAVEYWKEDLNGVYQKAEEVRNIEGTTDDTVVIPAKSYTGFTLDENNENNVLSGTVTADGELVLKAYYARNSYKLTVVADDLVVEGQQRLDVSAIGNGFIGDGVEAVQALDEHDNPIPYTYVAEYKYEQPVNVSATITPVTGYTVEFTEWTSNTNKVTPPSTASGSIEMPDSDVTLTAKGSSQINQYGYVIEYYTNSDRPFATESEEADYGTTISYPSDLAPDHCPANYRLDKYESNGVENTALTVSEVEANNIMKVYYVQTTTTLTIHHYLNNATTVTKVADDEVIPVTIGKSFEVTPINDPSNTITVDGNVVTTTRSSADDYINGNKYVFNHVDATGHTITGETVTGTTAAGMSEISYYYDVVTFNITGEVIGGNGSISIDGHPITVEYGDDVEDEISIIRDDGYQLESIRMYSGNEIDGDYDDTDGVSLGKIRMGKNYRVDLSQLCDIRENKHIVVRFAESRIVCVIVGVPTGLEDLRSDNGGHVILNHEYETLEEAIIDAQQANDAKDQNTGNVEIKILTNIDGELNTIDDNNDVIIDLNNYKVSANSENVATITVGQGGKLRVIDRVGGQNGKIQNEAGVGISVSAGGSLTLGTNEGAVSKRNPVIEGATHGINRENGSEFCFFDGRVIGDTSSAIAGNIDEIITPRYYEVISTEDGVMEIAYIAIPEGIEAMIGNVRYETLEKAFEAVENNNYTRETPVEIDLVSAHPIEIENAITLSENKYVKLDLNGITINGTQTNEIFKNYGKLEIIDSTGAYNEEYPYLTLTNNGDYYFTKVGDHLEANNKGQQDTTANSYIEIDLSTKPSEDTYKLVVNANISSEQNNDYGYITVSKSETAPAATSNNADETRYAYVSGIDMPTDYTINLQGGEKYYLHFGYQKNGNDIDRYMDTLMINDITIDGESVLSDLVNGQGKISNPNYGTIRNEASGELIITDGRIIGEVNNDNKEGATIYNLGTLNVNGGYIRKASGLAIANDGTATLSGGIITGKNTNDGTMTTNNGLRAYSVSENISNHGNLTVNGGEFEINNGNNYYGAISHRKPTSFEIKNATICSYGAGVLQYEGGTNGKITNANVRANDGVIVRRGTFTVTDVNCNGCKNTGVYLTDTADTVTIKNMTMLNDKFGSYGIYAERTSYSGTLSKLTVENANIKVQNEALYNHCYIETTVLDGTYISTNSNAITNSVNYEQTILNIQGGSFETISPESSAKAALYNDRGIVNIGVKNDEIDVSTTNPTLKSQSIGINSKSTGSINFYDGQVISKVGESLQGTIYEIEEEDSNGKELDIKISQITENETQYDRMILAPLNTRTYRIVKNTPNINMSAIANNRYESDSDYYYFYQLDDAFAVCDSNNPQTATTIELMQDVVTMKNAETDTGKNIILDLGGNTIRYVTTDTFITNDSKLEITNGEITSRNQIIDNRGILTINADIKYTNAQTGGRQQTRQPTNIVISNTGDLTVESGTIEGHYATIIDNTGTVTVKDGTINALCNSDSGTGSWGIANRESARCVIEGGTIYQNGGAYNVDDVAAIYNMESATIKMTGGLIDANTGSGIINNSSSVYQEGVSEPSLYITGGTVKNRNSYSKSINYTGNPTGETWIIKDTDSEILIQNAVALNGKAKIEGARIEGNVDSANLVENSKINIKNTTITGQLSVSNGSMGSTDTITGSTIGAIAKDSAGVMTLKNSTVSSGGISVSKTGELKVENSTVNGGITANDSGIVNIPYTGQTVINSGRFYGIEINGNATVTLGTKGGNVSEEYPKVNGNTNGVCNNSQTAKFYFYDGIITGPNNNSISGNVTGVETDYDIIKNNDTNTHKETAILKKVALAKIKQSSITADLSNVEHVELSDDSGSYYGFYRLSDAVNVCSDNVETEIIIIRDITFTEDATALEIPSSKKITVDFNGYSLTSSIESTIVNNGTLKVKNSDTEKTSKIVSSMSKVIDNSGTMTVEDMTIECTALGTESDHKYSISNTGTLTMNNVTSQLKANYMDAFYNTGTLALNNGSYDNRNSDNKFMANTGDVTINGTNIAWGIIHNEDAGTVEINNAHAEWFGIRNYGTTVSGTNSKPAIRVKGGYYYIAHDGYQNDSYGINIINYAGEMIIENDPNADTELEINGSTRYGVAGVVSNAEGAKLRFNSGKIGVSRIDNSGTADIYDIKASSTYINNNQTGTMNIHSGTYSGGYEVKNTGTLQLGDNNAQVISEKPFFDTTSEFENTGTLKFFDGTVNVTSAYYTIKNRVNEIPQGATIIHESSEGKETYMVSKTEIIAEVDNNGTITTYTALEDALAACPANPSTSTKVTLKKSILLIPGQENVIASDKNIVLDLEGNSIIHTGDDPLFENNCKLELKDSSQDQTGEIRSYSNVIVDNKGTLKVSGGRYIQKSKTCDSIFLCSGTGNMTVTGGHLEIISEDIGERQKICSYAIKSIGAGNITVTGGYFNVTGYYHVYSYTVHYEGVSIYVANEDENNKPTVTIGGDVEFSDRSAAGFYSGNVTYGFKLNNANLVINGGDNKATSGNILINSSATMSGGITRTNTSVDGNSSFTVTGASASVGGLSNSGTVNINAGTCTRPIGNADNVPAATINIKNAHFVESGEISTHSGKVYIQDSDFNLASSNTTPCASIDVHGGEVELTKNVTINAGDTNRKGIIARGGKTTLKENISVEGNDCGISITAGEVIIPYYTPGGQVNTTTVTATGSGSTGILVDGNGAKLTIGDNDTTIANDYPIITGDQYGIRSVKGTFNFYDGILHGGTKAFTGLLSGHPVVYVDQDNTVDYTIVFTDETETTGILGIQEPEEYVVKVGSIQYKSLSKALNGIKNSGGTGTVEFLKDILLVENVTIESGNNVTFEMNGHSLRMASADDPVIENNGTLTVKEFHDSDIADPSNPSDTYGYIENTTGVAIKNNGTLILGTDNSSLHPYGPRIIGMTYGVQNNGTITMYDGMIEGVTGAVNGTAPTSTYTIVDGQDNRTLDGQPYTYATKYLE